MNKGLFILILFGVLLLAFLYMSPVTPAVEATAPETEEAAEESPTGATANPDAMVDEALRQLQSGEVPPMQGIIKLRDIAEKYPDNVKANFTLGMLSMQTGQYAKAVERFETVLKTQPENGDAWRMMAESQMNLGDTTNARQSLQKAVRFSEEEAGKKFIQELPELE